MPDRHTSKALPPRLGVLAGGSPSLDLRLGILRSPQPACPTKAAGSFWMVLRGRAVAFSRLGSMALGPGEWVALDRSCEPSLQIRGPSLVLSMQVDDMLLAHFRDELDAPIVFIGRGTLASKLRLKALVLWRDGDDRQQPAGRQRKRGTISDLLRLVAEAQQDLQGLSALCPGYSQKRRQQVFLRLQRARLQLEFGRDRNIRVAELARGSNFSPWYFSKLFHSVYGASPQQFAVSVRLSRAQQLLAESHLPAGDVAAACGFENACSFSRAFRAHFGTTASEYRRTTAKPDRSGIPFGLTAGRR
jgi:AraC family transcriptional regulator